MRIKSKVKLTAALVAVGLCAGHAPTAQAGDDGTQRVLAMVGSDTTTFVMDALAEAYNVSSANTDSDRVVNVPPLHSVARISQSNEAGVSTRAWLANARRAWPGGVVVPADADCLAQRVYGGEGSYDADGDGNLTEAGDRRHTEVAVDADNDSTTGETDVAGEVVQVGAVAPNGSGSGRTFALDTTNNPLGCVDLARSSSAPSAGAQQSQFDSWGFALDAVGWTYFPGNSHGVTAITKEQFAKIYTCSAGDPTKPQITTWGELSGNLADTTPIVAYRVQPGSGTADDIAKTMFGLTGFSQVGLNCNAGVADAAYPVVQEHDCSNVSDADKPDAICFYGYSRWRLQARSLETDKRNGARFGRFSSGANTPLLPSPTTIKETAGRYEGSRIVYTLIPRGTSSPTAPSLPSFADALSFAGVTPGVEAVPGFVCSSGKAQTIIRTYGFVPFKLGNTDATDATYGQSYCRHNKYSL